jgi:RES domain-containing protein
MPAAWRVCKTRYQPFDGTGARIGGARWNSAGNEVIYAADSFPGALLELLAHAARPRTLPGAHHAVRIDIPDDATEFLDPAALPGWEQRGSREALDFGNRWISERRSAALVVPSVPSRPVGRNVLINPAHPDARRITVSPTFPLPWDERLF